MLTFIRCPFHPLFTAVARKRPGHSAKIAEWQVTPRHAYILDPTKSEWADSVVQAQCGNLSGKELTRKPSGNTWSQSSQLTEPLWTDPGLKSGISARELISTEKKQQLPPKKNQTNHRRGMNCRTHRSSKGRRGIYAAQIILLTCLDKCFLYYFLTPVSFLPPVP